MQELITFDDVLIKPKFSKITSRKDVNIGSAYANPIPRMDLPVISANMDTVTGIDMAVAMAKAGGMGCLHRFCSIEDNVRMFKASCITVNNTFIKPMVSIGLGDQEFLRAEELIKAGASLICIDVAHGAQMAVVEQYNRLATTYGHIAIVVGNFATGDSVAEFKKLCITEPAAFKIGIGPGSACTTRIKTGCGVPQLSAIIDCVETNPKTSFIADGGLRTPGDIAKALAAGASSVMVGGMLAGTNETPGEIQYEKEPMIISSNYVTKKWKVYRGSASKEAYEEQGKSSDWRTAEGESFTVPLRGPVSNILKDIEGGLRSSFSYVGAKNLKEFQQMAEFVRITGIGLRENGAHGRL